MAFRNILYSAIALLSLSYTSSAISQDIDHSPSLKDYEDFGQGLGMEWFFQTDNGKPVLEFGVKETSHRLDRLWELSCTGIAESSNTISNTIFAVPPEVRHNDQFGFSIRIDDGQLFGLVGQQSSLKIQDTQIHFPQFAISENHKLLRALQRGNRAYINLNGNKFSIHLDGSASAIKAFLEACKRRAH